MARARNQQSRYERRVTLALKWFYLDNLDEQEIQERFESEGYGSFTLRTIRGYLKSKPSEEVREAIEEEHANTRLQVADRQEKLYKRAREAEMEATKDEPVKGMVPQTDKVDGRLADPKRIPYGWEEVQPGEEVPDSAPIGADPERDTIIRILDDEVTHVEPGRRYPIRNYLGEPEYTVQAVGVRRDIPDSKSRSFLRQEQQSHLEAKGQAMGIYEETINLQGDLGLEAEVEVPEELVQAVIGASHDRLKSGEEGGESE